MITLSLSQCITQGEPLAATIGMFDGMHRGHQTLITTLKQEAARRHLRTAVITFERHPQEVVNPHGKPQAITTLSRKIEAIEAQGIDFLILLDFNPQVAALTAAQFMAMLRERFMITTLVMGYNHRFGHDRLQDFNLYVEQGRQQGVDVVKAPEYLGRYAPVSSTIVRQLIAGGRVHDALNCMGHPFELSGTVVHGFSNGRGLGFPTANVGNLPPSTIMPHNGAYAVMVDVEGTMRKGMVNIGYRPTLNNGNSLSVEVNIFDFEGDIYGKPITLLFIKFLRLEFKMVSVEDLRRQLQRDKALATSILDNYISQTNNIKENNGNYQPV